MKPAAAGLWRQAWLLILACLWPGAHLLAADVDWGVISVSQPTTITFASQDITKNFTDQYYFSLSAGTDASYAVTMSFDVCQSGCGNPSISYGVYDTTGKLISDSGSAVLTSGRYVLQVKGTGTGSGNTESYSGFIAFNGAGTSNGLTSFVSAVPEPRDYALMLTGLVMLAASVRHRRRASLPALSAFA